MIDLYRYQQVALCHLRFNESFILCMEQGTGKTIPMLKRILEMMEAKQIASCLVVCPKSVIGSWQRDIEKFSINQQKMLNKITIINYDKVWRDKAYNKQWDCIVLDEAHSIKNRTSKRSSFLLSLSINARYRYLLTGTPISNAHLEDLWALITFLAPYKNGRSICSKIFQAHDGGRGTYYEFLDKYCKLNQYHVPYDYMHVNELQSIFREYSFRITKAQCLELPEKLPDEIIDIELSKSAKKIYKDIAKSSASLDLDFVAENPLVRMTKLRQLASGFFISDTRGEIYDYNPNEKSAALEEFLEGFNYKLAIFAEFRHSIDNIKNVLDKLDIKYVVLDGMQKDKSIWRLFQFDKNIQVIVCQYQSACQGIDLYAANTMILYDLPLRSVVYEQTKDRIHRRGQHHPCSYIHYITKGTIEEKIYKALKSYSDFNEKMFNDYIKEYRRSKR